MNKLQYTSPDANKSAKYIIYHFSEKYKSIFCIKGGYKFDSGL